MKNALNVIAAIFFLSGLSARAQVTLQTFSSVVSPSTFFYGNWELTGDTGGTTMPNSQFVQGVGVYDFTGSAVIVPTDLENSKVEFFNASPVSIGSNTLLAVTAQTLATNLASSFIVILLDTGGKSASASFAASSFPTGSYATATVSLVYQSGFNSAMVDSLIISGGQPDNNDRFNFSFDNISAVPEPSTYAAIVGVACLGLAIARKRKRAVGLRV